MKNTLVVVADLACLKAFKLGMVEPERRPRLELIEEFNNEDAHEKLTDRVSDQGGRFPRATGASRSAGAMSDGERHNIGLERRKRLVRGLAHKVNALARDPEIERFLLAASREIQQQLLEDLEVPVRAKIEKNVAANLTRLEEGRILGYF